jgi:S-adenosylmethionine:tRNA ribosyltransferase-isomerase
LLEYLHAGDLLVLNNSKVIPARLRGINSRSGGEFEILLLEEMAANDWWAMLRPGRRARVQAKIRLKDRQGQLSEVEALVVETNTEGHRRLQFAGTRDVSQELPALGETPLPPYIKRAGLLPSDPERYQTVYAQVAGSVAAPTAGLHFTAELLSKVRNRGAEVGSVTLHVGLGTFAPVKAANIAEHVMHEERFELSAETITQIERTKAAGGRIIAAGTTTVRVLESVAAAHDGRLQPGAGRTRLFITPPWEFRVVDALLTNFHLPCSTLLMLVSAFAAPGQTKGRELLLSAYAEAIRERYRFFSYGDAMLIL